MFLAHCKCLLPVSIKDKNNNQENNDIMGRLKSGKCVNYLLFHPQKMYTITSCKYIDFANYSDTS